MEQDKQAFPVDKIDSKIYAGNGNKFMQLVKNPKFLEIGGTSLVLLIILIGGFYLYITQGRIYTDKGVIAAPVIELSPEKPGLLKQLLVREGDTVEANTVVARVGDDLIKTDIGGLIIKVNNEVGRLFLPGQPIVVMINPNDLRVEAKVEEDKGFKDVQIGQKAIFTVDAFGSRKFTGQVDQIAKTSDDSSVVFSISDTRKEKEFTVKIKFDSAAYPELLNGMSARVWIYK